MGKSKDLSDFVIGQIVMAGWVSQSISKTSRACRVLPVCRGQYLPKVGLQRKTGHVSPRQPDRVPTTAEDGIRMHDGQRMRRWRRCDALEDVLLGNIESCMLL